MSSNAGSLKRARLLWPIDGPYMYSSGPCAIGIARGRAEEPHLQLAGARLLHVLRPLRGLEDHADADRGGAALPVLVVLAIDLVRLGRHREHERRAVGLLAPAVAVAVDVAVDVEQRLRARDVVAAVVRAQRRIEAVGSRRHRRLRRNRLAAPDDPDLVVDVVRQLNRAAQRDLRRRIAADHRVLHVEVRHGEVGVQVALQADALLGEVGRELAVGRGDRRQLGRARARSRPGR